MATGFYDVAILAGNWDSRSTALVGSDVRIDTAIVCTLLHSGVSEPQRENAAHVRQFAGASAATVIEVDVDRKSQYSVVRGMTRNLYSVAQQASRPIRVLVDLAGLSRFTALAVMAWGFKSGVVAEFGFSYAIATEYEVTKTAVGAPYLFRSGNWLPTPIPGLGSPGFTGAINSLIVSAGFEGKRTRRLVDLLEPDELVLFLSMSDTPENNETLMSEVLHLKSSVHDSRLSEVRAPIGDIRETVQKFVNAASHDSPVARSVSILLAGPKITSLGAAIASLNDSSIRNVFYVQSEKHEPVDVLGIAEHLLVTVSVPWSDSVLPRD